MFAVCRELQMSNLQAGREGLWKVRPLKHCGLRDVEVCEATCGLANSQS